MRCDLHMHSTVSDGSLPVEALVEAVAQAGVGVFALTDHDSVDGLDAARAHASRRGITLINGVEISTRHDQSELHILGYGFDPQHPLLREKLAGQRAAREARIPMLVARLNELGVRIAEADVLRVAAGANPGRPHVARALVELGQVRDTDEAFRRYLGDSGPANVRKLVPSPREAIAWIHAAGGKAVWAHPLARPVVRQGGFDRMVRELRDDGLDGLEEVHPSQDPGVRRRIRTLARELGMRLSGGSDFHGAATPGVTIGRGRGRDRVDVAVVEALLA
ncbi:MAG: PHP domain-containing protein [Polyangiales bacterium]